MLKEIVVCAISIILICIGDFASNNYAKETIDTVNTKLYELKEIIQNEDENNEKKEETNNENINKKIDEVIDYWYSRNTVLAYFIEHDELEKVETALTEIKGNIESEEFSQAQVFVDKCTYILIHIQNKMDFKLENIL